HEAAIRGSRDARRKRQRRIVRRSGLCRPVRADPPGRRRRRTRRDDLRGRRDPSHPGDPAVTKRLIFPAALATAAILAAACKNSLGFGTTGNHPCDFPGTVCSTGGYGTGDGGDGLHAGFLYPLSAARDAAGNIYIADTLQSRIRRIDPQGHVTTVAGDGTTNANFIPGL